MSRKPKVDKKAEALDTLERIKRLTIVAMFSDDELLDELVLKGGNAMALIHKLTSRESIDLDFSMRHDFPDGVEATKLRIQSVLERTFRLAGFEPFDVKMKAKPAQVSEDLAGFWGGYEVEFKLVTTEHFRAHQGNLEHLAREALSIGQGKKFLIDISRFEYVDGKQAEELDGYRIYVYSPEMIACEKLRALCQQMEEYAPVVRRSSRPGTPRARDFFDIHTLVEKLHLDLAGEQSLGIIREMFKSKRVELAWLALIDQYRDFHRAGFASLQATVSPGVRLESFDFYFDYVVELAKKVLLAATAEDAQNPLGT